MTEAEWLVCSDPKPMLEFLRFRMSDRKLRLFACGCCRRVWQLLPDMRSRRTVECAEMLADGALSRIEAHQVTTETFFEHHFPLFDPLASAQARAESAAANAADSTMWQMNFVVGSVSYVEEVRRFSADAVDYFAGRPFGVEQTSTEEGRREVNNQVLLLRDIFGDPFRAVMLDPRWVTFPVIALARGIYDDRAFDRLPILADALIGAGCDNEDILAHCRSDGPHVRGCWVVDLVLGKT
jgi:hypothetical protein